MSKFTCQCTSSSIFFFPIDDPGHWSHVERPRKNSKYRCAKTHMDTSRWIIRWDIKIIQWTSRRLTLKQSTCGWSRSFTFLLRGPSRWRVVWRDWLTCLPWWWIRCRNRYSYHWILLFIWRFSLFMTHLTKSVLELSHQSKKYHEQLRKGQRSKRHATTRLHADWMLIILNYCNHLWECKNLRLIKSAMCWNVKKWWRRFCCIIASCNFLRVILSVLFFSFLSPLTTKCRCRNWIC